MIKVIHSKPEAKRYLDAVRALFDLYMLKEKTDVAEKNIKELKKIVEMIINGKMYDSEPAKKELFVSHFLKKEPIELVAEKINFSVSYTYALKKELLKELAMMVFEVIVV